MLSRLRAAGHLAVANQKAREINELAVLMPVQVTIDRWNREELSSPQLMLNYLTHFRNLNYKARTCSDAAEGISNFVKRSAYTVNKLTGLATMVTDMATGISRFAPGDARVNVGSREDMDDRTQAPGGPSSSGAAPA